MATTIGLKPAFTYAARVSGPRDAGPGPFGSRQYYDVTDGTLAGPLLFGRTFGAGGDWMLQGTDGYLRMDARVQVETGDGAVILVRYHGVAEANERLMAALASSEPTTFGDQRIRTYWMLETGDPRYRWVNHAVLVGEGRFSPRGPGVAGFEHRVYTVDR